MKRLAIWAVIMAGLALGTGARPAFGQATFKVPYPFQAAGIKLPKGEYRVVRKDDSHLVFRQEASGKEFEVPFTKRLAQPSPALTDPQLVVDLVGNFAPSYTEYMTDYVLAEVWLPGEDGYQVHNLKGAHKSQTLKGEKAK